MNLKEKRTIGISWAFVIFGSILAFFINIIASSVFDIYANGLRLRVLILLIIFSVATIFVVGFLSYIFENLDKYKNENSVLKLMWTYIKTRFGK